MATKTRKSPIRPIHPSLPWVTDGITRRLQKVIGDKKTLKVVCEADYRQGGDGYHFYALHGYHEVWADDREGSVAAGLAASARSFAAIYTRAAEQLEKEAKREQQERRRSRQPR